MNKIITILFAVFALNSFGQSYAPPANQPGTTAIRKDSSAFVAWATGVEIKRGYLNIADTNFQTNGNNKVSFGNPNDALNQAQGSSLSVVSLGDGGSATLTFASPITNGNGADFAVFENGFQADYLELAFVEVSSDGVHFFRFPSHSENQFTTQIGGTGTMDCRFLNNLAGKYQQGYGTPFDLSDLPTDPLLDLDNITHVKIVDVVGSIAPLLATLDSYGNIINDPFPTPFPSGGFDLDGVGVIHQKIAGLSINEMVSSIYPNPTTGKLTVVLQKAANLSVSNLAGQKLIEMTDFQQGIIDLSAFSKGIYLLEMSSENQQMTKRIIVE